MYQFISVDQPQEQYAELLRSRAQQRFERHVARDGHRAPGLRVRLMRRLLGRRRVARSRTVGRVVGA
jgi:hypothetical protein